MYQLLVDAAEKHYGVRVGKICVHDVTIIRSEAEWIVSMLHKHGASEIHLKDMIEDWLVIRYYISIPTATTA